MKERWGFLVPWCNALNKRFDYNHLEFEDDPHGPQKRHLVVTLPMRKFCSDEETFRIKFQQVREGLMLLSAVAHVDQTAWKYLLSKYCGVNLGKEGGEKVQEEIPARFLLILDLEERRKEESGEQFYSDLVEFCGVEQRKIQSGELLDALQKIAALDERIKVDKPGMEVEIPVRVLYRARQPFSAIGDRPVEELVKAARAERVIKTQWDSYSRGEEMKSGSFRCTFVLEPMIADFSNLPVGADMIETLSTLVAENVWFSRVTLNLCIDSKLRSDEFLSKKGLGQLVTSVFGTKRRRPELLSTRCCSLETACTPLQIGAVVLYCDPSLTEVQFEALCSAMVVNQITKRLSLSVWLDPADANSSATRWKWLAYALFSKRARESSGLESLTLTSMGSMSVTDMEVFKAVLTSEHPEEEIFGTARGQVSERNAVLATGAEIRNPSDDEEQTLVYESPIASVRTFSDDGQSEWVNAIVPGCGRCLVRRDDLAFEDFGNNQRGITSITIGFSDFNPQSMDGLGHFLESIGPSLKVLALDAMRKDLDVNFILQCCPNLEEISLRSLVVDVRFNFKEWQQSNQPLPDLNVDWADAVAVATGLQDSCSSFTKSLRRLRVRLNNVRNAREEHDEFIIKTIVAGLLQMLKINQTLEYLDVVAPSEYHGLLDELQMHHLKPICRSIPLLMQSKMAFLSIFPSRMPAKPCNVLGSVSRFELDQNVLHKIFQFAACSVRRKVYYHDLDWIDKYNEVPI